MNDVISERMEAFGTPALTDTELMSVVLGIDVESAAKVYELAGSLAGVIRRRPVEFSNLPGMTKARTEKLLAAVELGRRSMVPPTQGPAMSTPAALATHFRALASEANEAFVAVAVNARNRIVGEWVIARGWESGVNLTSRQVFTLLAKEGVTRVVFVHNHPSGDPASSPEDIRFTDKLLAAAKVLEIKVLDHVIVASGGYHSMREMDSCTLTFN